MFVYFLSENLLFMVITVVLFDLIYSVYQQFKL